MASKINKNQGLNLKTIIVNWGINYRQFKEKSLSAQKNAARCIGGQDKDAVRLEDGAEQNRCGNGSSGYTGVTGRERMAQSAKRL